MTLCHWGSDFKSDNCVCLCRLPLNACPLINLLPVFVSVGHVYAACAYASESMLPVSVVFLLLFCLCNRMSTIVHIELIQHFFCIPEKWSHHFTYRSHWLHLELWPFCYFISGPKWWTQGLIMDFNCWKKQINTLLSQTVGLLKVTQFEQYGCYSTNVSNTRVKVYCKKKKNTGGNITSFF